jgi:hypothetical protein
MKERKKERRAFRGSSYFFHEKKIFDFSASQRTIPIFIVEKSISSGTCFM